MRYLIAKNRINYFNMTKRILIYSLLFALILSLDSCGRSRRRGTENTRVEKTERNSQSERQSRSSRSSRGKSVIKMRKENGIYYVPCVINDVEMEFIFDTGASDVTISLTEAKFLYKQGKLTDDDIRGTQQYRIADGSIHEGLIVVLQKIEIGNRVLRNVQASIVNNEGAPLLLGQSALSKFGKVSIDYKRNEITFE
jgi:aspartyl protease family protein